MPVRYDDPRPPFEQLADELRQAIRRGDYQPGDRLPSTAQLARDNGISPMTVQHAIGVLRDEGLVVGQKGRGVYVQDPEHEADTGQGHDVDAPAGDPLDEARRNLDAARAKLDHLKRPRDPDVDYLDDVRQLLAEVDAALDQATPGVDVEPDPYGPTRDTGPDIGL